MIKFYNKLIRDKIPAIIRKDGREPTYKKLDDKEYILELFKKEGKKMRAYE